MSVVVEKRAVQIDGQLGRVDRLGQRVQPNQTGLQKKTLIKIDFSPPIIPSYLELVLVTSEGGALLLPEVVRLDDVGHVDERVAVLLQHLEDGFDRAPGGTPHVHHHGEPQLALLLAAKLTISMRGKRFSARPAKGCKEKLILCFSGFRAPEEISFQLPVLVSQVQLNV